mgnify:CR=1 FL=1
MINHLADGLSFQLDAVGRAVRFTDPGKQQSQIVIDLGDGPHGAPGIPVDRLLIDGDRRRQSLDLVDLRFFDLAEDASLIESGVANVLDAGLRTDDIMQDGMVRVSTEGMGDALLQELDRLAA